MSDNSEESRNRYQGILTQGDREYLSPRLREDEQSGERYRRHRLRKRVEAGLEDLSVLSYWLPEEDRKKVFQNAIEGGFNLQHALAFFCLGCEDLEEEYDVDSDYFEDTVEGALRRANNMRGLVGGVEVSVENDPEEGDPEQVRERILSNEGTIEDLRFLMSQGESRILWERIIEEDQYVRVESEQGSDIAYTPVDAERRLDQMDERPSA